MSGGPPSQPRLRFFLSPQRRLAPQSSGLSERRKRRPWHSGESPPVAAGAGDGDSAGRPHAGATAAALSGPRDSFCHSGGTLSKQDSAPSALAATCSPREWLALPGGRLFPGPSPQACRLSSAPDKVGVSLVTGGTGSRTQRPLCRRVLSPPHLTLPAAPARLSPPPGCAVGVEKGGPTERVPGSPWDEIQGPTVMPWSPRPGTPAARPPVPLGRAERDGPAPPPSA